jgi:hypothetical protein
LDGTRFAVSSTSRTCRHAAIANHPKPTRDGSRLRMIDVAAIDIAEIDIAAIVGGAFYRRTQRP